MSIIRLSKVRDLFVDKIRDNFNLQEKAELIRILTLSIEHDHIEAITKRRCDDCE